MHQRDNVLSLNFPNSLKRKVYDFHFQPLSYLSFVLIRYIVRYTIRSCIWKDRRAKELSCFGYKYNFAFLPRNTLLWIVLCNFLQNKLDLCFDSICFLHFNIWRLNGIIKKENLKTKIKIFKFVGRILIAKDTLEFCP